MILQLACLSLHDDDIFVADLVMQIISFMYFKEINFEMFVWGDLTIENIIAFITLIALKISRNSLSRAKNLSEECYARS